MRTLLPDTFSFHKEEFFLKYSWPLIPLLIPFHGSGMSYLMSVKEELGMPLQPFPFPALGVVCPHGAYVLLLHAVHPT